MKTNRLIQAVLQLILICFFSNAWGGCEAERDLVLEYLNEIGDPQKNAPNIIHQYKSAQTNRVTNPHARRQYEGWIVDKEKEIETQKIYARSARTDLEKRISRYRINAWHPFELCLLRLQLDSGTGGDLSSTSQGKQTVSSPVAFDNQDKIQRDQQSQQPQQLAQQNQSRADTARQGKRKTHDPAAEAHECIAIDKAGSGNYGAFKNQCAYPVNFSTCNEKPRTIPGGFNWSADFDCAKQQFGLHTPRANSSVAAHNRNTEFVYWFACKAPAMPTDVEYTPGKGLVGRCW